MLELLKKYPKSAKLIREYYLDKMLESLKDDSLPDEFKDHVRQMGIDDEKVAKMLGDAYSQLFSFFDSNKVYISVSPIMEIEEKEGEIATLKPIIFQASILGKQWISFNETRKEAEFEGVKNAFVLLEDKL